MQADAPVPDDPAGGAGGGSAGPPGGLPDAVPEPVTDIVSGVSNGLDVAAQWAGDTLRGIFGCLPWESACDTAGQAAGMIDVTHLVGVMGVLA